jgi:serine/threonine-protein kinase
VARSVADAVAVTVSSGEAHLLANTREVNPETYEAYLRGMHFLGKGTAEGLEKGMAFLQQAVDTDPADPLGYAGLASGYVILGHATGDAEYIRRAKAAARRALELDGSQAEAQATLAMVAMYIDWDWDAADEAFQRALELNPSQAELRIHYGALHTLRGDLERTLAEHDLARELDPLSPSVAVWQAEFLWPFGLYEKAEQAARTALELNPGFPHAHAWLGQTYLGLGRLDEALEHARIAAEGNPRWVPWLGRVLVAVGRLEEARVLLHELLANPGAGHTLVELAIFQAAYGDLDGAMATLERAHGIREIFMPWTGSWADLGDLTSDPRFQDLLARMNLEFVRPRLLAEAAEG